MQFYGLSGIIIDTPDLNESSRWFKKFLGYQYLALEYLDNFNGSLKKVKVLVNQTGGLPILLRQRLEGGQFFISQPNINNLGVLAFKVKTPNLKKLYLTSKLEKKIISPLFKSYDDQHVFWIKDSFGNNFIVENKPVDDFYLLSEQTSGGIFGVILGVRNIKKVIDFFSQYNFEVAYNAKGHFDDLSPLNPQADTNIERVILQFDPNKHQDSAIILNKFFGITQIDLISVQEPQTVTTNTELIIGAKDLYKPQYPNQFYQVIDQKQFTIVKVIKNESLEEVEINIVQLNRMKFRDLIEWNLIYPRLKISSEAKLKFIITNALEKV